MIFWGAAAQGGDCGTAALSASVVLNNLLGGDPSTMTATEKEKRKNIVATLVAGIAAAAGSGNIATATNAATIETANNYLSPVLSTVRKRAEAACFATGDANACSVKDALDNLDKATKKQMDDLVASCKANVPGACAMAQALVDYRNTIAESQKNSCSPPFDCVGNYQPSANENWLASFHLPGKGDAIPVLDPVTAYVMLRFGMKTPLISGIGAAGGAGGEIANQLIYNNTVNNYEKIAYNAIASWATGPIAAELNSVKSLALLSGTTNARSQPIIICNKEAMIR